MVFAAILIVAGALQDKIGPKWVMLMGVMAVGLGTIGSGFATRMPLVFFVTFGVIVGGGIGFVYACPRPAAMKWFHPSKKGMINGIVVAGFGLGALWLGPLELLLLNAFDFSLETTLKIIGLIIMAIGIPCALNVVDPPAGYKPPEPKVDPNKPVKETKVSSPSVSVKTTARTPQAWMLLTIYAFFCSAGALVISNVTDILKTQSSGGEFGTYAGTLATVLPLMVPIAALSNATGRASGGLISDWLGRKNTYYLIHAIAAVNMLMMAQYSSPTLLIIGVVVATVSYGAALSVTPSIVADYFGLKAYGANYGLVYYGWGFSLIIGPQVSSSVKAATGEYTMAYYIAVGLIAVSAVLVFLLKKPMFRPDQIIDDVPVAAAAVGVPLDAVDTVYEEEESPRARAFSISARAASTVSLVAGFWLVSAPFAAGYVDDETSAALVNDITLSILIASIATIRILTPTKWRWLSLVNVAIGAWLVVSPLVLGFDTVSGQRHHIGVGLIILVMEALSLYFSPDSRDELPSIDLEESA
jgi:MFS family permease